MSQTVPHIPADRFALIIEGLCHAVARRGGLIGLAGPLLILVWARLRRCAARFTRAIAVPTSRPRPNRPPRLRPSRPHPLPRRKAWLLRLVPEAAASASQLRHFLADPETASLLAADPRLGRILRPLCHALGIRPAQAPCLFAPRPEAAPLARALAALASGPPIPLPPLPPFPPPATPRAAPPRRIPLPVPA